MTDTSASAPSAAAEQRRAIAPVFSWRDFIIGTAAALATVAIWSAWPVVTRYGVSGALDPWAIALLRFLPPALILAPHWWRVGLLPPMPKWAFAGLLCGGLPFFIGAAEGFRFASVTYSVGVPAATIPLAVAVLLFAFFRVRVERSRLIGLGLMAVALAITLAAGISDAQPHVWWGQLLLSTSGLAFAFYSIAIPFSRLTAMQAVGVAAVWSLIIVLPFGTMGVVHAVEQRLYGELALQLIQQGILSATVSFITVNVAIKRIGPGRASAVVALAPVLAAVLAHFALGESFAPLVVIGLAIMVAGILLANRPPRAKKA